MIGFGDQTGPPTGGSSSDMDHVLLITGSMGAGKTTTLGEASDLLASRDVAHAAVDLDALGLVCLAGADEETLMLANLRAVCANYERAGIQRVLLAAAVESRAVLDRILDATAAKRAVVCRLRAATEIMEARVAARERGLLGPRYVARVRPLDEILDRAALEDFTVTTTDAEITVIARDVLRRAGWLA